jgi:ferredoxin
MTRPAHTQQTIDLAACSGCGTCADLCPAHVFEVVEEGGEKRARRVPVFADGCQRCGHCVAACPSGAIAVEGIRPEDLFPLGPDRLDADDVQRFLERRRSVRVFRDEPVPRAALERIVAMVALAPMAYTPHKLDLTVVATPAAMAAARPDYLALYEGLLGAWRRRLTRFFIRRALPPDERTGLSEHVMPTLGPRLEAMRAGRWDTITRGAPAMILFHSRPDEGACSHDAYIAASWALLAAHALGLGATIIDLVPPAVNRSPALRRRMGLPAAHVVHAAVILGRPRYRFLRGLRRALPGVHWV